LNEIGARDANLKSGAQDMLEKRRQLLAEKGAAA
jgi:hypothetical protein